jgi:hypothetical protein
MHPNIVLTYIIHATIAISATASSLRILATTFWNSTFAVDNFSSFALAELPQL